MNRLIRLISPAVLCALLAGCATTATTPRDVPRERNYTFAQDQASGARVAFIPKGAYILGLANDQSFSKGSWVRLTPGASWPEDEARPTLVTARIAERSANNARLEIAAFQPGIRTANLAIEPYNSELPPSDALHAMTKRMAFANGPVHDGPVAITLTAQDIIEGSEIYGALSLETDDASQRLANHITALFTIADHNNDTVHLAKAAGNVSNSPVFLLLDAPTEPAFDIAITLPQNARADIPAIENALRAILAQDKLPGVSHIHLERAKSDPSKAERIASLGAPQTETLSLVVCEEDRQLTAIDQSLRLRDDVFPVLLDNATPQDAATRLAAHALALLGHHTSAAFLLENAWRDANLDARAAIAPMLAQAYHNIERDDWALEIALELNGYIAQTKKNSTLRASAAAIFALTGRAQEFSQIFNKAVSEAGKLPASFQKLMFHAILMAQDMPNADTHLLSLRHALTRAGHWNAFDEMALCASRIDIDDDACTEGLDHASSPLEKLWFTSLIATHNEETPRLLDLALEADAIGAPNLAIRLWSAIIQNGLTPEAALSAYKTVAEYMKTAQDLRAFAHLMAELATSQAAAAQTMDAQTYAETLAVWRALDYRQELAAICTARAATASLNERIDLLSFAGMLYRSIGDAENSAITDSMLYKAHAASGNMRDAEISKERAIRFSSHSEHPEVVQALRENLTTPQKIDEAQ